MLDHKQMKGHAIHRQFIYSRVLRRINFSCAKIGKQAQQKKRDRKMKIIYVEFMSSKIFDFAMPHFIRKGLTSIPSTAITLSTFRVCN